VKPSLYSLKALDEALKTNLSEFIKKSDAKPYEFNFTIKITDMNQFITDLKALFKNHWRIIFTLVLLIWLTTSYTDQVQSYDNYL
jgi:hypothetical protein